MSEAKTVARSAFSFLSGTMVSRVSGLVRDMSMAFFFGTSASIAAFFVALRFAILLRRILGEGALLNGFVPHFESHRKVDPKQAAEFFRDVFFSLAIFLVALIVVAEGAFGWGVPSLSSENQQILHLVRLILPGIPFICLFGICSGLLHCEKYFFLTGVAPVAYNFIWIAAVWLFRNALPDVAAVGLSVAISFAFFFQWLITFPKTLSFSMQFLSWKEFLRARLFSKDILKMIGSLSLGVIGVAAAQISTAIDTVFSRFACLEGPAYLNFAIHLQQLPLALFGIGVASALLPPLSRAFASDNVKQSQELLELALSKTLLIILPCTVAIFALGSASINLIYGRGGFTALAATQTTYCLWGYGLGLTPMVITLLLAPAYYAKKDFWTPTICSLCSIGAGLTMNCALILWLKQGPACLAFSTSFSAMLNAWLLFRKLPMKLAIMQSTLKTALCALVAGSLTLWVGMRMGDPTLHLVLGGDVLYVRQFSEQMSLFLLQFATFSGTFLVLKQKELFTLLRAHN